MPYSVNGIGTRICGERLLTKQEINLWGENFPFFPGRSLSEYYIGTEAVTIIFPIFPLKTIVYCYTQKGFTQSTYQIIYFPPNGVEGIYWPHVKTSLSFYILPLIVIFLMIWIMFPK